MHLGFLQICECFSVMISLDNLKIPLYSGIPAGITETNYIFSFFKDRCCIFFPVAGHIPRSKLSISFSFSPGFNNFCLMKCSQPLWLPFKLPVRTAYIDLHNFFTIINFFRYFPLLYTHESSCLPSASVQTVLQN